MILISYRRVTSSFTYLILKKSYIKASSLL